MQSQNELDKFKENLQSSILTAQTSYSYLVSVFALDKYPNY